MSDGTLLNSISDASTLFQYSECLQGTFKYGGGTHDEDGKLSGNINSHSVVCVRNVANPGLGLTAAVDTMIETVNLELKRKC